MLDFNVTKNHKMSKRGRPKKRERYFQTVRPCFEKKSATTDPEQNIPYNRLPESTFKDAVHLSSDGYSYQVTDSAGNPGTMHFMRPTPNTPQDLQIENDETDGYKILHCGKLLQMFNDFYQEHFQNSPLCPILCSWNTEMCQKWGLSWRMGLKCTNCGFVGKKTKVYTESEKRTQRGQKYSTVNLGIHVGLQSSPLGVEGVRTVLLSGGIPVPSVNSMQKAGICVSDITADLNEKDMEERRKKLVELNEIRGFDKSHPVSTSGDGRYNNRLESGAEKTPRQPATQSIYCIVENETPNKDIICVNIDNMLCSTAKYLRSKGKSVTCPDHPGKCDANIKKTDTIGDEGRSAERCAQKMSRDDTPLVVQYFTSDGDSAASVGFGRGQRSHSKVRVENLRDTRHMSVSHRKVVKNIAFSTRMFPGKNKKEKQKVQTKFSLEVRNRCSAEVSCAHKQYSGNMHNIIRKLSYTTDSILNCLTFNCGRVCQKHSLVCSGRKKGAWKAKFLPPGSTLKPNDEDLRKLRECIQLRLGPNALNKTRLNTNTQKNESVNRTITKTNPKFSTWIATLPGRIHGAVHMRNCGTGKSIQKRCAAVGAKLQDPLVNKQLKNIDDRNTYHKDRKNSLEYKERQSYLRKVRFNDMDTAIDSKETYQKDILDPEFRTPIVTDHSGLCSKKPKTYRMKKVK